MKRLIAATIALSLLGATAASAQPYRHSGYYDHVGYSHGWHGGRYHDNGAGVALGLGLFALAAIASSHDEDRYGPPPPPPPRPYYGGYDYGYGY